MKIDKNALKEAFSDTLIATPLNLFLNFVFLSLFLSMGMGPTSISFALTAVFFSTAVIRKYYVRQWFQKRNSIVK